MSPTIVKNNMARASCSVSRAGIGFMRGVLVKIGWKVDDTIEIGWMDTPACILLRKASSKWCFPLRYSNARKKSGGRIHCNAFVRNLVALRVALPVLNVQPISLPQSKGGWSVALLLAPIQWSTFELSKAGVEAVPKSTIGVYELRGASDACLRIGQGNVRERFAQHLKDERFAPPVVKTVAVLDLGDSENARLMESVLIAKYEAEVGCLPKFQEIRA